MGKRTLHKTGKTHALRPRDYWPTIDPRAIPPLLPHLPPGRYAEPMAGNGSLIRLLAPHVQCAWAADLQPQAEGIAQADVFSATLGSAQFFISNPPWTRALLHKIILHLSDQGTVFLLFDADWLMTAQAGAFMERCRKVIYIGRLIWIEGTTGGGFSAQAWYEFGRPIPGSAPVFYGHGCLPSESPRRTRRICADCGVLIDRFGKWKLVDRQGVAAVAHKDCANPSGTRVEEPMPIMDWIGRPGDSQ